MSSTLLRATAQASPEINSPITSNAPPAKIVPTRHPGRIIATVLVALLLAPLAWSLLANPRWEWAVVAQWFTAESVIRGLGSTLLLTVIAGSSGFVLGFLLALMRISSSPLLWTVSWAYTWIFRSVPLLVQLLLWYNLGYLYEKIQLGVPFGPVFFEVQTTTLISQFAAAVLGLTLHQAAYSAEIIRGGILSVDQGQLEAAAALGIPRSRRALRIVLPQALRAILPSAFNEIIGLVKGTSVVYVLAYSELFYTIQVVYNRTQQVIPLLLVATLWYVLITSVLSVAQYYIERRFSRGATYPSANPLATASGRAQGPWIDLSRTRIRGWAMTITSQGRVNIAAVHKSFAGVEVLRGIDLQIAPPAR